MSAHSSPSLTSDSSSLPSATSDVHDTHSNDHPQPTVSSASSSLHALSLKDPEASSEITQLRNRVSKLEQDKFVLGDYAAELQSRIRQLERDRMENHAAINHDREPGPREKARTQLPCIVPPALSRPSTPTEQSRGAGPLPVSHHQVSSSLSAATSVTAKRALARASSLPQTQSLTASQLALPSSTSKGRLVPKYTTRAAASEAAHSPVLEIPPGTITTPHPTSTSTRRRLQAMCGKLLLDAAPQSPPVSEGRPVDHDSNDHEPSSACDTQRTHIYNSMPSRRKYVGHDLDPGAKRTAITSKLDSIILTSKLFPLSSSRSKAPPESATSGHRSQNDYTAVVSLAHTLPSSSSSTGKVHLDSPPRHRVQVKVAKKGDESLSRSLGPDEGGHPHLQPTSDEHKVKSHGRVSFSDRLFSPPTDRGDEMDIDTEPTRRVWGSWGRRKPPPRSLSFSTENRTGIPSFTPLASRFTTSRGESAGQPEEKRYDKRRSLAAGCLRLVSGSGERDKTFTSERRQSCVFRRSHSESRSPVRDHVRHYHGSGTPRDLVAKEKEETDRITPLRVGSPKPKGRVSDLQHGGEELQRTNSLRSAGKWGQRGRTVTPEFTKRRTIHPMFSFERPGSTGASVSSSLHADHEETVDVHRARSAGVREGAEKSHRRTRRVVQAEYGVSSSSHNHVVHTQDDSGASGNTVARSDSVSTHKGKGPMMRTRLRMQTHGTFAFEPATAVVIPPRSPPPYGTFSRGVEPSGETRAYVGERHVKARSEPAEGRGQGYIEDSHDRAYLDFCDDLKVVLGDGEDWATFKKYIRRFNIEVLTADVLLRRVKKLIDGSQSVNQSTKLKLYERFVTIVQGNVEGHVGLGS